MESGDIVEWKYEELKLTHFEASNLVYLAAGVNPGMYATAASPGFPYSLFSTESPSFVYLPSDDMYQWGEDPFYMDYTTRVISGRWEKIIKIISPTFDLDGTFYEIMLDDYAAMKQDHLGVESVTNPYSSYVQQIEKKPHLENEAIFRGLVGQTYPPDYIKGRIRNIHLTVGNDLKETFWKIDPLSSEYMDKARLPNTRFLVELTMTNLMNCEVLVYIDMKHLKHASKQTTSISDVDDDLPF